MALIKDAPSGFGLNGNYWRIVAIETHYGGPNQLWPSPAAVPVTFVHIAQYVSKQARLDGATSLQVQRIIMDGQTNGLAEDDPSYVKVPDHLPEPTRAAAYAAMKTMPAWADATDD